MKALICLQLAMMATVVAGAQGTLPVGSSPRAMAVNPVTNKVYVANAGSNTVTVIDGATNATLGVTVGSTPSAVTVNPVTNKVYVTNYDDKTVTVIDGATNTTATVTVGSGPSAVAVNPVTNKVYVANFVGNTVTVIDGATNATTTVPAGSGPRAVAVNPVTNKVYVANALSDTVTVIDGATNATATVNVGSGPIAIAVNPVTNKVYVANLYGNTVTVIDGANNATPFVTVGKNPYAVAVNPVTNKVYVANDGGNTVTVIDGANNATATVNVGSSPKAVAVNPVTNKIYVANNFGATVTVIDGGTNATATVTAGSGPNAVAVNPVTNKVYVTNHNSGFVTVIDGATNATAFVTVGSAPAAVAVNPVTNKIYVANDLSPTVTVIDGTTNATATVTVGGGPIAVAVNPGTNKIYVTNILSDTVTVIDGDGHQPIPLATAITGGSDALTVATANVFQTQNVAPSFTVGVTSAFTGSIAYSGIGTAVNPPPTAVYYEVDGGSKWTAATGTSTGGANPASFKITPSAQTVGLHTLYVYAAYGNEGGQNSTGNSPEIGNLTAYAFLIDPISTATTVKADVNPQNSGSNVTFTATVTPVVAAGTSGPTGVVLFNDGATSLGSGTLQLVSGSYTASHPTSSLSVGTHTISATYMGDGAYAVSAGTLTEKIVGSPTSIVATSGGTQTGVYGSTLANPLVATVTDANGTPVPAATVTFSGSGLTFSSATVATNANGVAQTTVTPAATGPRTASASVTGVNAPATFALTITQAATVTSLKAGSSSVAQGASITLDAQVVSAATGTPTGTVNFNDGTTLLSTVTLTGGAASYTTAPLSAGAHTLYAVYSGDPNFASSSTAAGTPVTAGTLDFTLTLSGGQSETVAAGSLAAYTFAIAPTLGAYPGMVTFVASGLPTGATAAFSPGSIAAGAGTQTVTVTIQTSAVKAMDRFPLIRDRMAPIALALLLLPVVGSDRMRRNMGRLLSLTLLLAGMAATSLLFTGCGSGASTTSTPKSFPVTITASSGNLQHTAAVTLNVQ